MALQVALILCFFFGWQTGFLGLRGEKVDAIDYYSSNIEKLSEEVGYPCPLLISSVLLQRICTLEFSFKLITSRICDQCSGISSCCCSWMIISFVPEMKSFC